MSEQTVLTVKQELGRAVESHRRGDLDSAREVYERVLAIEPANADAHHLLGLVALAEGRLDTAGYHLGKAVELHPQSADYQTSLGNVFQTRGQYDLALRAYRQALDIDPAHENAANNMANALIATGRTIEAAAVLAEALRRWPQSVLLHFTLGNAHDSMERFDDAIDCYRRALQLEPAMLEARLNMGAVLHRAGRAADAEACLREVLAHEPEHVEATYNLGNVLLETGAFAEAAERYHQVLKIRPGHVRAAYNLTFTRKWKPGDAAHRDRLAGLLDSTASDGDRAYLHFALGKLFDDQGEYDTAFTHFHEGNRLAGARYDRDAHDRFVAALMDVHSRFFERSGRPVGSPSDRPVFIVGMPRSGTSLVEEILARHPGVVGGGELLTIDRIAMALPAAIGTDRPYPACLEEIHTAAVSQATEKYLAELKAISPAALRVTDKMPLNFLHLGLIEAIFPKAVVVHCRRDPIDTCLSCYFQFFPRELSFSFDLEDLGHYYQAYERLMGHYNSCSSLNILEVHYEKLVSDTEAVVRSLLRHCGLPWEPRCLGDATARRPVKTASSWQVRQPMYKSSVARWRRYEAHVGPLLAALGEFAVTRPPAE